ncbi:hypothetical protein AJ79_08583 [Helicocarpus griseus UAMH5409]|uniref:Uncharacterized protein n=1 Tax=Helicocarpus griseus UAMH5409 TaxID=1447875 RepID=A0A2B7WS06_9EURO|nr:hypothetical protein AJ79_08583 [Helicocarpus griseus UAMH5409]
MLRHVLWGFSATLAEEDAENLNELLAWVTCAQQPLTLRELDSILRLKSPEGEGMIYLEGGLRKQFASFFSVTREDGLTTPELYSINKIMDMDLEFEDAGNSHDRGSFDDTTNAHYLDSDPDTTKVTFCHAYIGDFFRDSKQDKVSAGYGYPTVGVNFDEANFHVTRTCLELVCGRSTQIDRTNDFPILLEYATRNYWYHLQAVTNTRMTSLQKKQIAAFLCNMLTQDTAVITHADCTFLSSDNMRIARNFLGDEEVLNSLSYEGRHLIESTVDSPITLFRPLAVNIGRSISGMKSLSPPKGGLAVRDSIPDILATAEWLGFEKTALWHRNLAATLRDAHCFGAASDHFECALRMDPKMWTAREGMLETAHRWAHYRQSIELDKITTLELEQIMKDEPDHLKISNIHRVQKRIADSYRDLGDEENAFNGYRTCLRINPSCENSTKELIEIMSRGNLHHDIISFLKEMEKREDPSKGFSCLNSYILADDLSRSRFKILRKTAYKTDGLNFIIEAYCDAIRVGKEIFGPTFAAKFHLAELYYTYTKEQDKAIRIWDKLSEASNNGKAKHVACLARERLASYYLHQSILAGPGSSDSYKWAEPLEKLNRTGPVDILKYTPPSLYLGIWYRLNGMQEKANALFKSQVIPIIEEIFYYSYGGSAIRMSYHWEYNTISFIQRRLHPVLIAAGNYESALAVLFAIYNDSPSGELVVGDFLRFNPPKCGGICDKSLNWDSCYSCKYSIILTFCADCRFLLKNGKLPINLCSPSHDWFYISPRPQPLGHHLLVNGDEMHMLVFAITLKQRWDV